MNTPENTFRRWVVAMSVMCFAFAISSRDASAVFSTVTDPNGLPPPDIQCLTVGQSYTIRVVSDANHVALYYRTDGQQPIHLDSSVIKHPLQIPKSTTTASWSWIPGSSHISETGRIWADGHEVDHDSLNTWDSSNYDFAVRTSCEIPPQDPPGSSAVLELRLGKVIPPNNFSIPPELANFEFTTSTARYQYSTLYSGTFQLLFYDVPYTTFLLQSVEEELKPGQLVSFVEKNLLPNTFYPGNRRFQVYHRHGFWSALSSPSPPFWTGIEKPEKIAVVNLNPNDVTLKILTNLSNFNKGKTAVYFENITASTTSGWTATTTWTFTELEADTFYQFWAKARNGEGVETKFGGLVTVKTPALPEEAPPPIPTPTSTPILSPLPIPSPGIPIIETASPEIEILIQEAKEKITNIEKAIAALQKQRIIYKEPFRRFTKFLAIGSTGPEVVSLQQVLTKDPAIYPEGLITGFFGPLTEQAVKNLQEKYGIEPLGVVGPKTRAILETL